MIRNLLLFLSLTIVTSFASAQSFPYAEPGEHGFSAKKLDTLRQHLQESGSSSLMIVVDGEIIFEYGEVDRPHVIHSMRKALLNSMIGIAVTEGKIDTNSTLAELGIDDVHPLTEAEKQARVADVLKSRSGVYVPAAATSEGMLQGKPERGSHAPGTHYYYNNWDFNVAGHILEKAMDTSLFSVFHEQIAQPLGMQDFTGEYADIDGESDVDTIPHTSGVYQYELSKSKYPAYHFRMSTRDLARYGQLYLNNGRWGDEQLIDPGWIEASTRPYSLYNPGYGIAYGMLWYVLVPNENRSTKSFYHTGVGIHMLGVYPASRLVLVHRVDTEQEYSYNQGNFYKMIDLVWGAQVGE